ncbi:hypothetical protein EYF80_015867 [Liparis tanakae]|uniref:Uncharacterized protein n=1 Tax=Liparis tanakae TaxID=230148 RepID=A0A4Z2I7N3_9TELE|nr:hypothetical protein EYF80_015867 [Liparis tanakae]
MQAAARTAMTGTHQHLLSWAACSHERPQGVMARRAPKGRPPRWDVEVRRRQRGSGQPGEGQGEGQRDGVAEVDRRTLGKSAHAAGRVGGRRLGPTVVMRLQKDERQKQEQSKK